MEDPITKKMHYIDKHLNNLCSVIFNKQPKAAKKSSFPIPKTLSHITLWEICTSKQAKEIMIIHNYVKLHNTFFSMPITLNRISKSG